MAYKLTDGFCGAGGSSQGAAAVDNVEVVMAMNHWRLAVDSHQVNFPDAAHDVADISQARPERYPTTDILWMSPECTNHTQAKGRRAAAAQPDLFGESLPDEAADRSRATMWDVVRFAEYHRYRAVIVENVVEVARWIMFPAWLQAWRLLGYTHQFVYLSSMHAPAVRTRRAPQSRDRVYIVLTRVGDRVPDVNPRPPAWCPRCEQVVAAVQWWKRAGEPWGRYRRQYLYRCPNTDCRNMVVEPFADPAASIIDWSLPGQRIGDRATPLRPKTMARIQHGLEKWGRPMTFEAAGNTFVRTDADGRPRYARAWPVDEPTATLTTSETRALVVPMEGRDGLTARPVAQPARTLTGRHQDALVVPYYGRTTAGQPASLPLPTQSTVDTCGVAFIAELRGGHSDTRPVVDPLATVTASGNHHMLVRNNGDGTAAAGQMCTPVTEPARTITTTGHQSLVGWDGPVPNIDDCTYRMLEPHEIGAAMAFGPDYTVLGTRRERVKQYGNAVTPPAAEFLVGAVVAAWDAP